MARSTMECLRCHSRSWVISRPGNKRRKRGHVKHMWCVWCKERTPHREIF